MTNAKFLELFQTHISVVEQYGGEVSKDPGAIGTELKLTGVDPQQATSE
jgi:hypothetical protein